MEKLVICCYFNRNEKGEFTKRMIAKSWEGGKSVYYKSFRIAIHAGHIVPTGGEWYKLDGSVIVGLEYILNKGKMDGTTGEV
jgi:hypothetical protein